MERRRPAKDLRRAIQEEGEARRAKIVDLSASNIEELENKIQRGKVVARFMEQEGWDVIEDIIMQEGRTNELVRGAMSEDATDEDERRLKKDLIKFGVVTRIINRLHLIIDMGDKADEALRKRASVENADAPTKKERVQSERRGKGSPR